LANWVEGGDVCYFGGVTCAKHPKTKLNTVGGIDFNGFHLGGPEGGMSLEGFLGTLPDIVFFHVNGNNFSGGILDDYSHLDYFYELDLSDNKFSGPFPSQFLTATKLTLFDIRFNKFSGPIPEEVFHLDLEVLFLNNNQFTGSIPTAIGKSGYYYITLANNQLTGGIPQEITQQKDLLEILFDGNTFGGTIPDGPWETVNLTSFYASNCGLTGTIPESLCELPSIVNLNVTGNDLDKELGPSCKKMMK
ncbi:L domain-like protein, partial [Teratosphaeria nubilosa]